MSKVKAKNQNLIKNTDSVFRYNLDLIIMMTPLFILGSYFNGFHAFRLAFSAILSGVITEFIACKIMKTDNTVKDLSAVSAALAISLMLPASCPAYIAASGAVFSVLVAKIPFGGAKNAPFVPAAAGFAFLCVCFPTEVFTYPSLATATNTPIVGSEGFVKGIPFSEMLSYGKSIDINYFEMISVLSGKIVGPIGTTSLLAFVGIGIYLLIRRSNRFVISISFILTCVIMAMLFPRVNSGILASIIMELSSGTLLFVGLILLHDPATAPSKLPYSVLYGVGAGVICMLLRYFAKYPEAACFSVLIMNAISPVIEDYIKIFKNRENKKKKSALNKAKGGNENG